ncbi:MAG: MxaK protein [Proteobacteria bacterium]|nr:MxaK protein [Pseudomonadota bacterium]
MGLATRRVTRIAIGLLIALAAAAAIDGVRWWEAARDNGRIASGAPIAADPGARVELRFARAAAMGASAPGDAALNAYRALQSDPRLGHAARYNSANLLVRQAVVVRQGLQPGQAIPLLELAKESYRDVLRDDPGDWDARYNLERAQRLLPDPDEADDEAPEPSHNRERAATTMRGYAPGLP